jgi:hypothetical protein
MEFRNWRYPDLARNNGSGRECENCSAGRLLPGGNKVHYMFDTAGDYREVVGVDDAFEHVTSLMTGLVQQTVSRQEAAEWAMARIKDETAG